MIIDVKKMFVDAMTFRLRPRKPKVEAVKMDVYEDGARAVEGVVLRHDTSARAELPISMKVVDFLNVLPKTRMGYFDLI